jgi:hypothetical protein
MTEAKPVDEYGIADILKRYNAEEAQAEIEANFDSFCKMYMSDHDEIREDAFIEMVCYLQKAIIDSKGDNSLLRGRIKEIIKLYTAQADCAQD